MRNGTPNFQPARLVEARDARGLTQVALGELINRMSSNVSRWESGGQSPEPDAVDALARALN
ncbi:MAG: helix-turn-helix transcriptional regulator, partial [Stellaceae bacterium]